MAAVDEDLLLHSDGEHYETLAAIDEDALLGVEEDNRKSTIGSVDSISQIDSFTLNEQKNSVVNEEFDSDHDETTHDCDKEELDYDEDDDEEEKRERTSRYASEKRKDDVESVKEDIKTDISAAGTKTRKEIPSLFDNPITVNPLAPKFCPPTSAQPIAVKLKMDGGEQVFLPPTAYPQYNACSQIIPRLPNGIPLIPAASNHGSAGFGNSYQPQQIRMAGGGGYGAVQWDQAVDMFLKGSVGGGSSKSYHADAKRSRRRRSSSYSSYSSYSSDEYISRSRSRSNSKSPRRRRDRRSKRDESRKDRRRKDVDRKRSSLDHGKRKDHHKSATIESAKMLGLPDEYLNKMGEQKRRREEIIRKKEERRNGITSEKSSYHNREESINQRPSSSCTIENDRDRKIKAYLAVNVAGLKQLTTAVKRIEQMATDLGPIRKCWRSNDDVVSIIFNTHDKAKDFMIKYNNKVLSGLRMVVSLEKKFLNISEVNSS